ncbi:Tim10/DDP family zinc finger-domain-containing protein [Melanogaster broomeanus]|nr:Tim10/DDP family zinc finger-domain-containing protein [Melanogaster broomeanus]
MSDFLKSAADPKQDVAAKKEALMNTIRSEMALAQAQDLLNKTNEKCFAKCIVKPGTSLSSSEETCLARCMDRYMETFDIVSRTYAHRISKESNQMKEGAL